MIQTTKDFLIQLYNSRGLIIELALRDYKQQNQGSYLGLIWNYLQPVLFILVLFLIFTLGFRSSIDDSSSAPFSTYLVSGMVCWLYFSANISSITGVIRSYSFLVKKVDFRLSILPIVKILSSLLPHLILLLLALLLAISQNVEPSLKFLQLFYYFFCMVMLLLGVGWLTSSTSIFVKDVTNIVSIVNQFGFWMTPIFWKIESMPSSLQTILKINPAYYLVTGYRDSITGGQYFWERPWQESFTFWLITSIFLILGITVFKRLKPHFAEVI